jgi:hypothetical protein
MANVSPHEMGTLDRALATPSETGTAADAWRPRIQATCDPPYRRSNAVSEDVRPAFAAWVVSQSRRKVAMPLSVSGWWIICVNTLSGTVAIWAPASGLGHMARASDRGGQHLGVQVVGPNHRDELAHDLHAILVDVIEASDERRQE